MRQRRGRLAADDGRGFVDQRVVGQRLDHEQGEVDAARAVARQHRIADVPAPHRQALALALFQIAAAHHRPARVGLAKMRRVAST